MRAVIQRVGKAGVKIDGHQVGAIDFGVLVLLGVAPNDLSKDVEYLAKKIVNLRIFEDKAGKMNLSLADVSGQMLVVSQFTLLGDCRKGRRPSFIAAAEPKIANTLYDYFVDQARKKGVFVQTGIFQSMMAVSLINDGPVTFILESKISNANR